MLLRSSSAPALSSLISERDHHDPSPLSKPLHQTPLFNSAASRGLSLRLPPSMRRACSEADLQALSSSAEVEDLYTEEKKHHPILHSFAKLSVIQEKEQSSEVRAVHPGGAFNRISGKVHSAMIFENDMHSALAAASAAASTCDSAHGCALVKESESLGPLLMASGYLGASSKAENFVAYGGGGGVHGCDGGRGNFGGGGGSSGTSPYGDSDITDSYYQKLLQSDPQNPLYLRNYAQYLSEAKHDLKKSEEYYERAILASPNDGEILSKYANHIWDVHKDSERADSYFDQAVKATPDDCYVLASYASFLWQSEDDGEDNNTALQAMPPPFDGPCAVRSPPVMASA